MAGFRFNPRPEVSWPVEVNVPGADGVEKQSFTARFVVLPASERRALAEDPQEALARIWIGWDDILDTQGKPIRFSEAARAQLLEYDYIVLALSQAYARATAGIERKN